MIKLVREEIATFLLAVQFLTRMPIPTAIRFSPERQVAMSRYFPLVGVLIGGFSAGVYYLASLLFPNLIALLIGVSAGVLITGAFHEDGLADTFDGIGGGKDRASSLEIMRDSRLGTYGTLALVIVLTVKLATLSTMPLALAILGLTAAHGLSRYSSFLVMATSQYARPAGVAKTMADDVSGGSIFLASLTAGLCFGLIWYFAGPGYGLAATAGLLISHVSIRLFFEKKLGGYTGDTLGATQQVSELGVYLGLIAWAH